MPSNGLGHFGRFTVVQCVVITHQPLQLGKLAYHFGQQISLAQPGRAFGQLRIAADPLGNGDGQFLQTLHALQLAAELVVINHMGQAWQAGIESGLAILFIEKLGVGKPCPQHAGVAVNDVVGFAGLEVADQQIFRQQFGLWAHQCKVFLVLLHRQADALGRHPEEIPIEFTDVYRRPLDNRGHFVKQVLIGTKNRLRHNSALLEFFFVACKVCDVPVLRQEHVRLESGRGHAQLLADRFAPFPEARDDLTRLAQDVSVFVSVRNSDKPCA